MKSRLLFILLLLYCCVVTAKGTYYLFIGTYTNGLPDKGIYVYRFNTETGQLIKAGNAENVTNPSYLTIAPNGHYVYACTESLTSGAGSVSAFAFDSARGTLSFINKQSSGGENPVYAVADRTGKWLINANYTQASVAGHAINDDGSLQPAAQVIRFTDSSINKDRQTCAHTHAAVFAPQQDLLYLPDLGADKIRVFSFDPVKAKPLQPANPAFITTQAGGGPRHFTFHPSGRYAYCIEELSGNVVVYENNGTMRAVQTIFSYAKRHKVYGSADIHVSPDGLFLYASNRVSENTISIFSIDQGTGRLTLVGHQFTKGDHPRNFTIDPTGNFLIAANQVSNNVVVFKRNKMTGALINTNIEIKIPHPSCLQIRAYNL